MAEWIESLLNKGTDRWPEALRSAFARNFTGGVFCFRDGDPGKGEFLKMCGNLSVGIVQRKRRLVISTEEIPNYPYYYLRVAEEEGVRGRGFLDRSNACPGDEALGRCWTGVVQSGLVEIFGEEPKADITLVPSGSRFHVYIVSRRLKEALESMNVTGVGFLPCRGRGEGRFQLRIIANVVNPPDVGNIRVIMECPSCGLLRNYEADHLLRFRPDSLVSVDFQSSSTLQSHEKVYPQVYDVDIISSRVQALLASGEFTGGKRYLDFPRVDFGVVEIEGASWLR